MNMRKRTLYTAVGHFRNVTTRDGAYPVVLVNHQEYRLDPQEMTVWSILNWRLLDPQSVEVFYEPMFRTLMLEERRTLENCLGRLVTRGLVAVGHGETDFESLYDLLGGLYVLFLTALEALLLLGLGQIIPITQPFPLKHSLIFLGVLFVVSWALFLMQQILSLLISSQLIPLFIGLLGSFVGVFSAFFPMDKVTGFLPWGYYIVGLTISSWYDEENRISYYFESSFRWPWFVGFLAFSLILYFVGKRLFLKKEV